MMMWCCSPWTAQTGPLKSSHDVLKDDPTLRSEVDQSVLQTIEEEGKKGGGKEDKVISSVKKAVAEISSEGGDAGG